MALFEVPGWSMPADALPSSSTSRKRKRGGDSNHAEKLNSAEVNIEKLMKKLDAGDEKPQANLQRIVNKKKRGGEHDVLADDRAVEGVLKHDASNTTLKSSETKKFKAKKNKKKMDIQPPKLAPDGPNKRPDGVDDAPTAEQDVDSPPAPASRFKSKNSSSPKISPKKGSRKNQTPTPSTSHDRSQGSSDTKLTSLQSKMRQTLDGARFRWINETLYRSDSKDAERLMRDDPKIFEDYHTGFRHQVTSWPTNPVDHFKQTIAASCPARSVIVDLGCGDAALARALLPKGFNVISFDLVSTNPFVVAADICKTLPLPGAEVDDGEEEAAQIVDVVVCSLSLMSTNWVYATREARRVLKLGGELKIAEVASRFTDMDKFTSLISTVGFKLKSKDDRNSHFTLFDFKKIKRNRVLDEKEWEILVAQGSVLQPCEYKRR